jgi:hypothetical protein
MRCVRSMRHGLFILATYHEGKGTTNPSPLRVFHPASQRRPNGGPWYQRPGTPPNGSQNHLSFTLVSCKPSQTDTDIQGASSGQANSRRFVCLTVRRPMGWSPSLSVGGCLPESLFFGKSRGPTAYKPSTTYDLPLYHRPCWCVTCISVCMRVRCKNLCSVCVCVHVCC